MAYFTRKTPKPKGYYTSLAARSTADIIQQAPVSLVHGDDLLEVERIIAERKVSHTYCTLYTVRNTLVRVGHGKGE